MLQRLLHHIPPDNFMFSGLRATVYHYFDDLTLALILRIQSTLHLGVTDLFDLFYRCYPTVVYFLLGAALYCLVPVAQRFHSVVLFVVLTALIISMPLPIGVLRRNAHPPRRPMMC